MGRISVNSKFYKDVVAVNIWVNERFGPMFNFLHRGTIYAPFGWRGHTISAGLGVIEHVNGGTIPWRYPVAKVIGAALNFIDKHHNREALEK